MYSLKYLTIPKKTSIFEIGHSVVEVRKWKVTSAPVWWCTGQGVQPIFVASYTSRGTNACVVKSGSVCVIHDFVVDIVNLKHISCCETSTWIIDSIASITC